MSLNFSSLVENQWYHDLLGIQSSKNELNESQCLFDDASTSLIKLALTELFVLVVSQFAKAFLYWSFNKICVRRTHWKPILYLSDFTIWMIYNQAIHWVLFLVSPYFVFVAPLLNLVAF